MLDLTDMLVYWPRPSWGQTDADLLSKVFEPNKAAWEAAGQWFVTVPAGVQNGAVYNGLGYDDPKNYSNPDGRLADGTVP